MAKRATKTASKSPAKAPVDVRVVAMPDAVMTLLQDLPARLKAVEQREAELRETVARLEERIEALQDEKPGMLMGAGGPVLAPEYQRGEDNQVVGVRELVGKLGQGIFDALPEDSAFTVQDADVDLAGAAGLDNDNATMGINPRRAVTGDTATRVKFTLRRKPKTKVVE